MSGLPFSPTPAAPGDTTTAFGMLGRQLQWRPLLLVGLVIVGLLAVTSISLETGDTWDRQFDRPLYFAVLLGSLVMAVRLWQPGQTLARASWQLLQAVTGWLLLKFALLLLFAAPGILARELVESLLWLPTLLNWGLISSFNLGRVALGRRITLSFLALSALLSGAWLLRWGWEPQVIQVLLQLLLSSATGYVYMSYFIQRVQQSRFSEGEHETLARLAYTDLLTGLPNRLRLQEELERRTAADEAFAVLIIDLDSFKVVNDTLGHNAGDTLLCAVTEVLRASPDTQAAFRLNGDEFVVLLSGVSGPEAVAVGQSVQTRALRHPLMQREVASTLSIGVSLYPRTRAAPARCCGTPTAPCPPSSAAGAVRCGATSRNTTRRPSVFNCWRVSWRRRSTTARAFRWLINRSTTWRAAYRSRSRRCCAGATPSSARFHPPNLSR
ncbi:GGDEF domain-containing protein [Deinococcus radiodurans]|nr:GGDEF domain-containing protein [Deinococcus radiodurans]